MHELHQVNVGMVLHDADKDNANNIRPRLRGAVYNFDEVDYTSTHDLDKLSYSPYALVSMIEAELKRHSLDLMKYLRNFTGSKSPVEATRYCKMYYEEHIAETEAQRIAEAESNKPENRIKEIKEEIKKAQEALQSNQKKLNEAEKNTNPEQAERWSRFYNNEIARLNRNIEYLQKQIEDLQTQEKQTLTDAQINEVAQNPDTANALEQLGAKVEDGKVTFQDEETRDAVEAFIETQIAWHGSPHSFDEFSLNSIGIGEGNQVHGWGLYFAKDRTVGESYKANLSYDYVKYKGKRLQFFVGMNDKIMFYTNYGTSVEDAEIVELSDAEQLAFYALYAKNWNQAEAIKALQNNTVKFIEGLQFKTDGVTIKKAIKVLQTNTLSQDKGSGTLFKVEIPDTLLMLDERKPFSEQPPKVKEAFKRILKEYGVTLTAEEILNSGEYDEILGGYI